MRMRIRESFWSWIRDEKIPFRDPEWKKFGSGINIPDPQHCSRQCFCLPCHCCWHFCRCWRPLNSWCSHCCFPPWYCWCPWCFVGVHAVTCVPAVLGVSPVADIPAPASILVVSSYPADLVVFYVLYSTVQCDILDYLTPAIGQLFFLLSDDRNNDTGLANSRNYRTIRFWTKAQIYRITEIGPTRNYRLPIFGKNGTGYLFWSDYSSRGV